MGVEFNPWLLVILAGLNNCLGSLLLKQSRLVATDNSLASLLFSPWFIGGLCVYGINVVLFAKALEKLPVSAAYPVLAGLGFALIAIAGNYFFEERLGLMQYIGMGVIFVGIILMTRS
ncbi:MAG: EamA family transporter [Spirulina sp. SIO3F2]|nr:EamA family transporter [Spirulina sp. SIO3F2]